MKQLHKFYQHRDIPGVKLIWAKYYTSKVPQGSREVGSFWWKDILRLNVLYRGIAVCSIGDGSTVMFWDDLWSGTVLSQEFPRLHSFALDQSISVKCSMEFENLDDLFSLLLSIEAFQEYQLLQTKLQDIHYDGLASDNWTFIWG